MDGHANRKDFFYYVVLILTVITVAIGMTFALYYWIFSQKEGTSAVYTGTLSVEYLSGNIINFDLLFPSERPNFNTEKNVYRNEFKVTNTGSLDGLIRIDLDILVNEFSDGTLHYILFNSNGDELVTGELNGDGNITLLDNVILKSNAVEEFVLIVWLNETYQDQNIDMKKYLTGTFVVDASQQKD